MVYKAIVDFKDLMTGHDYKSGDVYPYEGVADADRVKKLITPTPQRGPLIGIVAEVEVERKGRSKKSANNAEKTK